MVEIPNDLSSADGRFRVLFHDASKMEEVADEVVPLTITSPPYGIGIDYAHEEKNLPTDVYARASTPGQVEGPVLSMEDYAHYVDRMRPVFREMARVTVPGGYVAINIAPIHSKAEFFGESFMFPIVEDISYFWRHELGFGNVWKYYWLTARTSHNSKGDHSSVMGSYPIPLRGQVMRAAEEILVFRKQGGRKFSEEREADRRRSKLTLEQWRDVFGQVWVFPGARKEEGADGVIHPAPFPVELPERIIRGYSCVGDLVLDPFLGSGTTMLAARRLGRRCIGYEVEGRYRDMIATKTGILGPPVGSEQSLEAFEEVPVK
ncbi:MAG: site-specific DNA-methyltransferase [Thermoplasmata archaeon]